MTSTMTSAILLLFVLFSTSSAWDQRDLSAGVQKYVPTGYRYAGPIDFNRHPSRPLPVPKPRTRIPKFKGPKRPTGKVNSGQIVSPLRAILQRAAQLPQGQLPVKQAEEQPVVLLNEVKVLQPELKVQNVVPAIGQAKVTRVVQEVAPQVEIVEEQVRVVQAPTLVQQVKVVQAPVVQVKQIIPEPTVQQVKVIDQPVVQVKQIIPEPTVQQVKVIEQPVVQVKQIIPEPTVQQVKVIEQPVVQVKQIIPEPTVQQVKVTEVVQAPVVQVKQAIQEPVVIEEPVEIENVVPFKQVKELVEQPSIVQIDQVKVEAPVVQVKQVIVKPVVQERQVKITEIVEAPTVQQVKIVQEPVVQLKVAEVVEAPVVQVKQVVERPVVQLKQVKVNEVVDAPLVHQVNTVQVLRVQEEQLIQQQQHQQVKLVEVVEAPVVQVKQIVKEAALIEDPVPIENVVPFHQVTGVVEQPKVIEVAPQPVVQVKQVIIQEPAVQQVKVTEVTEVAQSPVQVKQIAKQPAVVSEERVVNIQNVVPANQVNQGAVEQRFGARIQPKQLKVTKVTEVTAEEPAVVRVLNAVNVDQPVDNVPIDIPRLFHAPAPVVEVTEVSRRAEERPVVVSPALSRHLKPTVVEVKDELDFEAAVRAARRFRFNKVNPVNPLLKRMLVQERQVPYLVQEGRVLPLRDSVHVTRAEPVIVRKLVDAPPRPLGERRRVRVVKVIQGRPSADQEVTRYLRDERNW